MTDKKVLYNILMSIGASDEWGVTSPNDAQANVLTKRYHELYLQDEEFWKHRTKNQLMHFKDLLETYTASKVIEIKHGKGQMDQIYTADASQTIQVIDFVKKHGFIKEVVSKPITIISHFGHSIREAETNIHFDSYKENVEDGILQPRKYIKSESEREGNGNNIHDPIRGFLYAAESGRASGNNPKEIYDKSGGKIVTHTNTLEDEFFHSDVACVKLNGGHIVACREAFPNEREWNKFLKSNFPDGKDGVDEFEKKKFLVEIDHKTAFDEFRANMVNIGNSLFLPYNDPAGEELLKIKQQLEKALGSKISAEDFTHTEEYSDYMKNKQPPKKDALILDLEQLGYHVIQVPMDGPIKGGGATHCCVSIDEQKIYRGWQKLIQQGLPNHYQNKELHEDAILVGTKQSPDAVIVIQPKNFYSNPETAKTNNFQQETNDPAKLAAGAIIEHTAFRNSMKNAGVAVVGLEGNGHPDELFLNNWFSTHDEIVENGKRISAAVIYPMLNASRQAEVREDMVSALKENFDKVIDFRHYANEGKALEGTGSLVLDRVKKIAYAALSERTDVTVLNDFAKQTGYSTCAFNTERNGQPIYHTNVMMWVGTDVAAVCTDVVKDEKERKNLMEHVSSYGREVILLNEHQINNFAGNAFEISNKEGTKALIMSDTAYKSLEPEQIKTLEKHYGENVLHPTFINPEHGGGSIRCAIAALHSKDIEKFIKSIQKHAGNSLLPDTTVAKAATMKIGDIEASAGLNDELQNKAKNNRKPDRHIL